MQTLTRPLFTLIVLLVMVLAVPCGAVPQAQEAESGDRTLSPYFFVQGGDSAVDRLPLKETSAQVNISGVIADVLVTQVYKNEGSKALEAIYIFPASTRAAVYGMRMTIGERVIQAKIDKREAARQQYEQARDRGQSASLLEQQRPNVFQMNVANIMPGDTIKVELTYTELLIPSDGVYEFVYPTVVGPRYYNQSADKAPASEQWVQNPYLHEGEAPPYGFDINVTLSAGLPIRELTCTSHKVKPVYQGPAVATVALDPGETAGGNRDYVLRYRLAGDKIQSGLLLYEGAKENFFLLMMQPPKRVRTSDIPGREYIFIVDVSGSMYGFPLDISKKLLKDLIGNLRPSDCFNVLLFAGSSSLMAEESLPATAENIQKAIALLDSQQGGGGTELLPALNRALGLKKPKDFSRTVVIATDGYVTVEEEAFDLIRSHLEQANMFAFGIGSSVNRHLIEGMAHVGMGEPFVITAPEQAPAIAERFRTMVQSPVLTQVKADFQGFDVYDVEPPSIPDVLAERPVIVFGKWRGRVRGEIVLRGVTGEGRYATEIEVDEVEPSSHNGALRYLWARHRITLLSDYNKLREDDKRIKEVTELGLTYSLLTAYTSFVAIDTEVRNHDGTPTTVKQPLPLPQGVSDYAVGGGVMAQNCAAAPALGLAEREQVRFKGGKEELKSGLDKDQRQRAVTLRVDKVAAPKSMTEADVTAVVNSNLDALKECVAAAGKGKITFKVVLNAEGTVKSVSIIPTAGQPTIDTRCLIEKVKAWQFNARTAGGDVEATITLVYES
jgi:Ca-activated chloride channel homolog